MADPSSPKLDTGRRESVSDPVPLQVYPCYVVARGTI